MPLSENESDRPADPHRLVEHFFRHESANLVAVLTRAFGIARIDLVEDMVQSAVVAAMHAWKQKGIPDNPAGWIHRAARNRILDALRREKTHLRALAFSGQSEQQSVQLIDEWLDHDALPDSLLRMMFVCCHPKLDRQSQIALTLKILCGFSVGEISRGLLLSHAAVKKRIQRAKTLLAELNIGLEFPAPEKLKDRLSVVHDVLYLMFNEGYSTSHGIEPIRDEVCEEAARLCHLLCEHSSCSNKNTQALLALMLFHASRLDSRTNSQGQIVLLQDQDRSTWDRKLMGVARLWLTRSVGGRPSRFHYEAVIAQIHCAADNIESTDWSHIAKLYDLLLEIHPSPIYQLNRAIAIGQTGDHARAHAEFDSIRNCQAMRDYYLLDCAVGQLYELAEDYSSAIDSYLAALSHSVADHERQLIERRLSELAQKSQGQN